MNDMQIEKEPGKKVWATPVIAVIDLNAAQNRSPHNTKADGPYTKS